MNTKQLINKLNTKPEEVSFNEVIETIESDYIYKPSRFTNGSGEGTVVNDAGTNEGSCKIFAFAQVNNLSPEQTLHCFGDYYRDDVLNNPKGTDHANIRNFMITGWQGILFETQALIKK